MFCYIRWRREKAAERKKLEALGLLPPEDSPAKNKQVMKRKIDMDGQGM